MQTVLEECKLASDSDAIFTWASEDFLLKENVSAWSEMPLWLPEEAAPHLKGFMFINCDKAIAVRPSLSSPERNDQRYAHVVSNS